MAVWNERIKQKRQDSGLTLSQVADRLNVTEATAQRYESGSIKNIPYDQICSYAALLKTTPSYIMGWEDTEPISSLISKGLKEKGITVEQLAELVGVSVNWITNIDKYIPGECEEPDYGYSIITKIAEVLGIPGNKLRSALAKQEVPIDDDAPKISAYEAFGGEIKSPICIEINKETKNMSTRNLRRLLEYARLLNNQKESGQE